MRVMGNECWRGSRNKLELATLHHDENKGFHNLIYILWSYYLPYNRQYSQAEEILMRPGTCRQTD